MPPARSYTNWNSRATDSDEKIEPYECDLYQRTVWLDKQLMKLLYTIYSNVSFLSG